MNMSTDKLAKVEKSKKIIVGSKEINWGYWTSVDKYYGVARLDIRLGPPTEDSSDPEQIQMRVGQDGENASYMSFGLRSKESEGKFPILPGYIKMTDRYGKEAVCCCFGGNVS